jgi:glycosyltransferase involved in cell wall biosynthesis
VADRRPRLLYLAFFFPPSRASGVFRARATANYFAESGWDVTVLRGPDRFFEEVAGPSDPALSATVDPRVRVRPLGMDYAHLRIDVGDYSWLRGNFPELHRKRREAAEARLFPDRYTSWSFEALREGRRLHRREPFDLVLATGNPFSAFWCAWKLGRRGRVPYAVDYRDSWTLNQFENADMFPPEHPAWRWEERILRSAAASLHVNDAMREWHAHKHPVAADRMQVVMNGWDPDVFEGTDFDGRDPQDLSFAFVGTLTDVQPIGSLLDAFQLMRGRGAHPRSTLDFYGHIGFFASTEERIRARLGLDREIDGVRYRGPVPKTEIATAYAASDVLVFLNGGSKYVTTGKVFEYMATGKPIVSVHEKGCAAEELLRDYPLWFEPASLDAADVAAAMAEAGDAARKADPGLAERCREYAQSFTRYRALAPFEEWARELVGRKQ